ncbi:hypothetical protein PUN28_017273 [Cardiocondyla obscurior]|uniref:limulus clotting factor C n=1 Tax=Cardiocondyla obscurior TaxID=286306 RepID=A0AAW2ENR8_9HYME
MTCFNYFFVALCLIYIAVFSNAIYDPRLTTTKPPERRESVLPWHVTNNNERDSHVQTTSSPKWYQSQDVTHKPDTNWSAWQNRSLRISNIKTKQRTQLDVPQQVPEQIFDKNLEQQKNYDFDSNLDQQSSKFPFQDYGDLTEPGRNYGSFKNESKYGNRSRQNEIDIERKGLTKDDEPKKTQIDNEDLYEGVATDSTKPRKENLRPSRKSQHKVARYDPRLGVQCPDNNSTGQFVYPPDCKFFVNCWKGRAFVQPCVPGTYFNPETLECDFPHKVKCYEAETVFGKSDVDNQSNRKSQKLQEPRCLPYAVGLFPHLGDCTKFIQCANGATYIMDCGPGTVFNPITSVCDWPYNVKGCEDTFKTDETILTPPNINFAHDKAKYIDARKITCPADFTGLLPHPETCKQFLQCTNGITYVMDCGPGTVFNPITLICDWPYNVPGCQTDKPEFRDTVLRPNLNHDERPFNPRGYLSRFEPITTINPIFGSTWRPVATSSSLPWAPLRTTTPKSFYDRSEHIANYHNGPGYTHRDHRYQDYGPYRPEWQPSGVNTEQSPDGNYKFPDYPDRQWTENPRPDQNARPIYHFPRPEGSYGQQDYRHDHGPYYPPGYHYHYHHHHYYGPMSNPPLNPNRNLDSSTKDQRYDDDWRPDYNPEHTSETDQRPIQPHFSPEGYDDDDIQFSDKRNDTKFSDPAKNNSPSIQRINQNLPPNRQDYGRTNSRFYPYFNHTASPAKNVSQNNSNKFPDDWNDSQNKQDKLIPPWSVQENIWKPPNASKPNVEQGLQNRQQQPDIHRNPWSQGENNYKPYFARPLTTTTERISTRQREFSRREREFEDTAKEQELHGSDKTTRDFNLPSESIESSEDNHWSSSDTTISKVKPPNVIEPEVNDYDVDILDDKHVWKPRLVFENKTETTTSSVIMKIGPKTTDIELFNIETAPFQEKEPPFPIYYVHPVYPIHHSKNSTKLTPISGQTIRLRGGSGPNNGYVEVQGRLPGWGIVCDSRNSWTLKEAHILCRQLGYVRGAEMVWQGRNNNNDIPTWIAANTVTCFGNETTFQSCKFTHSQECRLDRDAIGVRCAPNRIAHCHKDEVPHNGQCYHLAEPESGFNHAEALDYCKRRNSRLVDILSQAENNFISEWLLQSYPEVNSTMTSGFGFTSMSRTLWLWADSVHAKFKFTKWWPGWMNDTEQPPWVGSRPLCIVMKRKFSCHERPESTCDTDYFFWDTEDCAATSKGHYFICKRSYDDIGCVYGKGNQYTGQANVTVSGNACLPWGNERIARQLRVTVPSREIRDKLEMHNYCRNPNPVKESRPWCYIETGRREYCDIPACGNIDSKRSMLTGQCKPKHFECTPGECIPSPWVCDGEEDCTNGADERKCILDLNLFEKSAKHKLDGYDVEKWLNTPLKTCALRCKEADFTCRSFTHKSEGNVCLLSDSNIGLTGALKPDKEFDYYELKERSLNCDGMYVCNNRKCINQTKVCDGKNDCDDRSDEKICTAANLDYDIRLAGANNSHEGRIEVKILGHWGQVCDDGFGIINADVVCKELGFDLGALEVRPGGFYGNLDPPTRFMVDQLKCRGDEASLRECDFNGWGVHNCQPEEAVGVVCKTAVNTCQEGYWKCDNSPACIPTPFICDEVVDCPDKSDESPEHCDAPFELRLVNGSNPMQGRVEVRHHGVWGTVCDDDFTNATAIVICRSLGYGGIAAAKKNGFFGPGQGPIWLDEVFCHGNESQLHRCEHNHWGQHNCDHNEDAGVICSVGDVNDNQQSYWMNNQEYPEQNINDLLPSNCGQRAKDFDDEGDLIFQKVVHGTIAPKGTYPWQASIRVRGHSRSSHWCGAVIISPLHVLTAAHCLEGYNKGTYFVRAGDYNTDISEGTEVEANIEDYYVHEEFRKGHRMNNDIALVLLKGLGIPLGKDIMPICLPPENAEYSPGFNCTISGFGSIEMGKTTQSKDLRYGWVPLLDQSICRASYVYGEGAISDGMMCAGYLDEGVDTCDGDSGGPLACYHNGAFSLYGITSWGQHCGKANKPGVYVRVAHYRSWIDKKIKESLAGR